MKEILNEREAAEYLGITASGLRYIRRSGTGPRHAKVGRAVRYLRSDVVAWFEANRVDPAQQRAADESRGEAA